MPTYSSTYIIYIVQYCLIANIHKCDVSLKYGQCLFKNKKESQHIMIGMQVPFFGQNTKLTMKIGPKNTKRVWKPQTQNTF